MHCVLVSLLHFLVILPSEIVESADTHIETEGDVDVCREVEAETRSKSERIEHRITRIFTLFYAEFTVSFDEEVHPIGRKNVDTTTIDQGVGTTTHSTDETDVSIETERSANLLKVESEDQFTAKGHAVEGVGMSLFALGVQVPSVTRTDTHGLIASGEVELSCDGSVEQTIGHLVERELCLCPEFEVTAASLPHITFAAAVGVGMIVVERQDKAYVHKVRNASCNVDICSHASGSTMECTLLIALGELATTSKGP